MPRSKLRVDVGKVEIEEEVVKINQRALPDRVPLGLTHAQLIPATFVIVRWTTSVI